MYCGAIVSPIDIAIVIAIASAIAVAIAIAARFWPPRERGGPRACFAAPSARYLAAPVRMFAASGEARRLPRGSPAPDFIFTLCWML
jgi:hypothetical protein